MSVFENTSEMYVTKRNGKKEIISFDKILQRIKKMGRDANIQINYTSLVIKIIDQLFDGIPTDKIDEISAEQCASMSSIHYDYGTLASRLIISNHHRNTTDSFSKTMKKLYSEHMLNDEFMQAVNANAKQLDAMCDYSRDYLIDYFGFKTLERAYLLSIKRKIYERPQMMFMRLAVAMHGMDLERIAETYTAFSLKQMIHGTPSLYNAGSKRQQMSSCFARGTMVHTVGGPVPIEEMKPGFKVVTHTGEVRDVTQLHVNRLGDHRRLMLVRFFQTRPLAVTDDHRLWIYNKTTETTGWKAVSEMSVDDYAMVPKNKNLTFVQEDVNMNKLAVDSDINKFFGIWVRYGDFLYYTKTDGSANEVDEDRAPMGIQIVLPIECEEAVAFCLRMHKMFGDIRMERADYMMTSKPKEGERSDADGPEEAKEAEEEGEVDAEAKEAEEEGEVDAEAKEAEEEGEAPLAKEEEEAGEAEEGGEVEAEDDDADPKTKKRAFTIIRYISKEMATDYMNWFGRERRVHARMYQFPTHWVRAFLSGWNVTEWPLHESQVPTDIYTLCRTHRLNYLTFFPLDYQECDEVVEHEGNIYVQFESMVPMRMQLTPEQVDVSGTPVDVSGAGAEDTLSEYVLGPPIPDLEVYTLGVEEDHSYSVGGIAAENCYLVAMESDSIEGIYNTLKDCAQISKYAGGIGLHIHNIRATGSHIAGTNGTSNGIVPMLRVFNNTAKYVDQCVHPSTVIYTTQGPTNICDIIQGETAIFGMHGETETVQNVLEHSYAGNILRLETEHGMDPLVITPEHPIFIVEGVEARNLDKRTLQHMLNNHRLALDWVEAKEVAEGDYCALPIPTHVKDAHDITADDCYIYGQLLINGVMVNDRQSNGSDPGFQGATCSLLVYTPHVLESVIQYLESRCVSYVTRTASEAIVPAALIRDDMRVVEWPRSAHLPFRWHDLYDAAGQRHIASRWLFLPLEKSQQILKGVVDAIGVIEKDITLPGLSRSYAAALRMLWMRMGILTRTTRSPAYPATGGGGADRTDTWSLHVPATIDTCALLGLEYDGRDPPFVRYGQWMLSPVTSVRTTYYQGTVYDLQMSQQHDYLLANALVHNGGGKRNGSIAVYLEPWHADIEFFLQMRKNHGEEELKARDLFYALWVSDLFMQRVKDNGKWTLFCPNECPGLADVHGPAFELLYQQYEESGRGRVTMPARDLWFKILDAQMETGTPYLVYKDAANRKSNQQNLGTIKSSNLCSEIIEYSDEHETAVCNLGSIALPAFVVLDPSAQAPPTYDFEKLHHVTRLMTYNLNRIIDINYYPTPKTEKSNLRHRPIGMGVQGLADTFMLMGMAFGSPESRRLNQAIFETIYHAGLEESCELAKSQGHYESFPGSPASKGQLQFDLWDGAEPLRTDPADPESPYRYDWTALKTDICKYGMRNSLLLAPMPTASTSQILGYNECIEPITSNIYSRRTLAGEFIVTNKYLMRDLIDLGYWNERIKNHIIANNGSIQNMEMLPANIREKYRTVWEIPMRTLIDMAAERGVYIDQSQSLNLWVEDPTYNLLTSMHFHSWSKGLKTGIYYLRRRAKHQAQQFTIEPEKAQNDIPEDEEICEMCSS